ncbi:MAG: hypothetical protein FWG61_03935, partial [Firmicutes bacterium]|nr:hypothetical protein [Bacillota bacterium]
MKMKIRLKKLVTLLSVIETSVKKIKDPELLNSARKRPHDFTRDRKMPFSKLILFMINMVKSSIQTCLDSYFEMIGQEDVHMTEQS